mmetsp:Transcript_21776/g.65285  ORF Transcript_21776/g.65285 Transcript_21776/m.65285 type:complete len:90 (-) Transcript_21776:743-1012(-)
MYQLFLLLAPALNAQRRGDSKRPPSDGVPGCKSCQSFESVHIQGKGAQPHVISPVFRGCDMKRKIEAKKKFYLQKVQLFEGNTANLRVK